MRCLAHWFWFATIHVSAEGLLRILLPPHAIAAAAAAAAGVTSASPQVIIETRGQDSLVQQETLWVGPGLAISRAAPNAFVSGCSQLLSLSDSSSPIAPRYEPIKQWVYVTEARFNKENQFNVYTTVVQWRHATGGRSQLPPAWGIESFNSVRARNAFEYTHSPTQA